MHDPVEKARRIGALSESFVEKDDDPITEEIYFEDADEIREILERVEELAWFGVFLDDLLAPRRMKLRHAFPGARAPMRELSRIFHAATGYDRAAQPDIDAVMLQVCSGRDPFVPAVDFLAERAGLGIDSACERLAPLCGIQVESVRRKYYRHKSGGE